MIYHHEFCEESKELLAKFIEACKDLEDYNEPKEKERAMWEPFMKYCARFGIAKEQTSVGNVSSNPGTSSDIEEIKTFPYYTLSDLEKELQEEYDMLQYYVHSLLKEPEARIREVYRSALPHIKLDFVIQMGEHIMDIDSTTNILLKCYCEELLFQMMNQTFINSLKDLFEELCNYNSLVIKQLVHFLKVNDELEILFLYVNSRSVGNQILREFLNTYEEPFVNKHLLIMNNLVHICTEYNSLKTVTEILSTHAVEYKEDKDYGMLLLRVITYLGPKVQSVKSQIDRILSVHVSMWKIKLNKAYAKYSENS